MLITYVVNKDSFMSFGRRKVSKTNLYYIIVSGLVGIFFLIKKKKCPFSLVDPECLTLII